MPGKRYYIVDCSFDDFMLSEDARLVPHDTLDDARKARIKDGDTNKLFNHGGHFPGVYISDILEILDENGLLEGLIEQCREARRDLDNEN